MNTGGISADDRLAALRDEFDRSFVEAPPDAAASVEDFLDIRAGTASYALRIGEVSGVLAAVTITPVPTGVPELLGVADVRGAILPVYDLRALLGHPAEATPRWLALAAAAPVALAFDVLEAHVRVRPDAVARQGRGEASGRHVREVVVIDGRARPIVAVASVLEAITRRVHAGGLEEE